MALSASLWYNIDLASPFIKDKYKTTETVRWLCENRLTRVQELNVGKFIFQFNIFASVLSNQQETWYTVKSCCGFSDIHIET